MHGISFLLLLTIVLTDANSYYNYMPIIQSPGLYYEKVGTLNLYNDNWKLITYLNLQNYRDEFKLILLFTHDIQRLCLLTKNRLGMITSECDSFNKTVTDSIQNIRFQDDLILDMLGIDTHSVREKRALINAIGTISKTLFGTLDADDAKYYDDQIEKLKLDQNHLSKLLKRQTSILQNTVHLLNSTINSKASKYFGNFSIKINEIVSTLNRLSKNDTEFKEKEELIVKIDELVSILNMILMSFKFNQSNLLDIILYAERGILHPLVISPVSLVNELSKLQAYLDGLSFPINPVVENMHILYNLVKTNVYYLNGKISFVILIPLIDPRIYDVLKVSSLPILISNSTYIFVVPQNNYLAIYAVKQHYFLLDRLEISECNKIFVDNYICKQQKPIYLVHLHGGCEANLFSPTTTIPESCEKRLMKLNHSIFIQLASANTWLYVIPSEEIIDINCKLTSQRISIKLNNTGVLYVDSNCTAYTRSMILKPHQQFSSNILINYIPPLDLKQVINFNISSYKAQELSLLSTPIIIGTNDLKTLSKLGQDIQLLQKEEDSNDYKNSNINIHNILSYSLISVIVIALVLYFIFKTKIFRNIFKRKNKVSNETQSATQESACSSDSASNSSPRIGENCTSIPRYNFQK